MSRLNHYGEEIKCLKRILSVLDGISYVMAFYELFIEKSITVGLVITVISLGLNVLIAYIDNEEKILHFAEKFKWEGEGENSARYFVILSIIYILMEIICFGIANSIREYNGLFWGVFVIFPVVYSILASFCMLTSINNIYQVLLESQYTYLLYFIGGLAIFFFFYGIYWIATYIGFKRNINEES